MNENELDDTIQMGAKSSGETVIQYKYLSASLNPDRHINTPLNSTAEREAFQLLEGNSSPLQDQPTISFALAVGTAMEVCVGG